MKKFANYICNNKITILVLTGVLFFFSIIGYILTGINYDILVYLPTDIETVEGQNILTDEFNMGAYTVVITKNLNSNQIANLEKEYLKIEGVNKVLSVYDLIGSNIPIDVLPSEITSRIHDEDSDLLFVTFDESTSSDQTIKAVRDMREVSEDKALISGMSSMVVDTMDLSSSEIAIYVIIAVILCLIILEIFLDSYLVPILLLANIGIAIIFNLGSNIIFGEISYITKALVAVLQLGVTTDFSIFLYHSYENEKRKGKSSIDSMQKAITKTFKSVAGSSSTTIVGFLVLCAMQLTLGKDLGLVMAKGVLIGVLCVLTIFPSLILCFDKYIEKTRHKSLKPHFEKLNCFVIRHHKKIFVIFVILFIPFYLAYSKVDVYYKIDRSLPESLESIVANKEISEKFNIVSPEIILVPQEMKLDKESKMINELTKVTGIDLVLSENKLLDYGLTPNMLPKEFIKTLESNNYRIILINSTYEVASDELNNQVDEINNILNKYDERTILAGEGALMKDLVAISAEDFNNVNNDSIFFILLVMLIVLKSISLPLLLVAAIEFAIFMNMGISYFSGSILPFVAPIVLGTIQLGATIDYAILLTTSYLHSREKGMNKEDAMLKATNYCDGSIFVSGLCFFAATFGVGIYSDLEMVGSLCTLISRGAILSMLVVIVILPSILLIFDKLIMKTTLKGKENIKMKKKVLNKKKMVVPVLIIMIMVMPVNILALTKEELVYSKLDGTGKIKSTTVNEHLINNSKLAIVEDYTDLKDIINISGDEKFKLNNQFLTWDAKGNDIIYQGISDKMLPITETITYKLDGKKIALNDLIGKKGKIEILIKYQNNDLNYGVVNGKKEILYTPFVVTTAMALDGEYNTNVKVSGGKVVDNGGKYMVVGISTPGLYESLNLNSLKTMDRIKITFETQKFELPSIYMVATPKLIDSNDLTIFDKMDSLSSNVSILQDNMNVIENSTKQLAKGVNDIDVGTSKIHENLNIILDKISEIRKGTTELDQGLKIILSKLEDTKANLNDSDNINKINEMKELLHQDKLQKQNIESKNKELKNKYESYNLGSISYNQILLSESESKFDLYNLKYTYENFYESNNQLISLLSYNINALESSLKVISEANSQINELITTLSTYLNKSSNGATTINEGIIKLENGLEEMTIKVGDLATGTTKMNTGVKNLSEGISQFNKEGINELSRMSKSANKLTIKLKKLTKLSDNYGTYTLSNDKMKTSTKFISVVDSIKVKEKEKDVLDTSAKLTFWDRFINLFK